MLVLLQLFAITSAVQALYITGRSEAKANSCEAFATTTGKLGKATQGDAGGAWSACTHLKAYGINSSPGFNRFLSAQIAPKTALEFGCGLGTTMDFLRRRSGADVTCIEPEETARIVMEQLTEPDHGKMQQLAVNVFDEDEVTSRCVDQTFAKKYDLVYSLEVAEHIPFKYHAKLIQLLAQSTGKFLVFSAARPGQGGTGHINESSFMKEEWIETFEKAGMVHMPKLSNMARVSAQFARGYDFFGNAVVFKNEMYEFVDTDIPVPELLDYEFGGSKSNNWGGWVPGDRPNNWHHPSNEFVSKSKMVTDEEEATMWPVITELTRKIRAGEVKCDA